jgi:hypothetical protein
MWMTLAATLPDAPLPPRPPTCSSPLSSLLAVDGATVSLYGSWHSGKRSNVKRFGGWDPGLWPWKVRCPDTSYPSSYYLSGGAPMRIRACWLLHSPRGWCAAAAMVYKEHAERLLHNHRLVVTRTCSRSVGGCITTWWWWQLKWPAVAAQRQGTLLRPQNASVCAPSCAAARQHQQAAHASCVCCIAAGHGLHVYLLQRRSVSMVGHCCDIPTNPAQCMRSATLGGLGRVSMGSCVG